MENRSEIQKNDYGRYILGLDLGANSLGWAAIGLNSGDQPAGIVAAGVRVFNAAVANLDQGKDESNNVKRREARLARRQIDRRRRRIHKIYRLLSAHSLLPPCRDLPERIRVLAALDRELAEKHGCHTNLPYFLRARALDQQLEPYELGRALFHLAQRRGFLSNRKTTKESDEERSKIKASITDLGNRIQQAGKRTLGEYLASLTPSDLLRLRGRYTSRQMYCEEFERIWNAQKPYYPEILADAFHNELYKALFSQRPLDDQSDLIGDCELEPGEKRAPMWDPIAQRFRLLQAVNNLRLIDETGAAQPLDTEQRAIILERLDAGDLRWKEFRKLLRIGPRTQINLESGGNDKLIGNRTEAKMREAFGPRWNDLSQEEKLEAIRALASRSSEKELAEKAVTRWGLNALQAEKYAGTTLEFGKYAAISLRAMKRLLPRLERGEEWTKARQAEYPESFATGQPHDFLPVVGEYFTALRNPAVVRTLSQLRKVVNALIREFGKPEEIHIELARDLKASRKERETRWRRMRDQQKLREEAFRRISDEIGVPNPSRADIEKWLLAEECRWCCPYSGKSFSKTQLFHSGEIQVEHIIPFARSLDDSFANKTLAYAGVNKLKHNRTPREAFGNTEEWEAILQRVRTFQGMFAHAKLRRFQMDSKAVSALLEDFTQRQLNDTRYASRLAARYVGCLYGNLWDSQGRRRVFVSPGQVTATLRRLWSIENVLGEGGGKNRDDHRHHAIDAIVIALTGSATVKELSEAASRASQEGRRRFASINPPWPGFAAEVRTTVTSIIPSRAVSRKVRGALHDETHYGLIRDPYGDGQIAVRRKPVHELSQKELEQIVDPVVRERVRLQVAALGGPAQNKKLENNWPTLPAANGKLISIKKVRIRIAEEPRRIGNGLRQRYVLGGEYHHFEIFRFWNDKKQKWILDFRAVSIQEALERVRAKEPVVRRDHGPSTRFVCSVAKDEILRIEEDGQVKYMVVRALEATNGVVGLQSVEDARPYSNQYKNRRRVAVRVLFDEMKAQKMRSSPLGILCVVND